MQLINLTKQCLVALLQDEPSKELLCRLDHPNVKSRQYVELLLQSQTSHKASIPLSKILDMLGYRDDQLLRDPTRSREMLLHVVDVSDQCAEA